MDTLQAYGRMLASRGKERMIFDWDKAAQLIRERKPKEASAGLRSDWEWTGGCIYANNEVVKDSYTYLASPWAVPELDLDGEIIECYRMESEVPAWNESTKWPDSAVALLHSA